MRLKRYINEQTPEEVQAYIKLIKKDCGPFLKELRRALKGDWIYRGIKRGLKSSDPISIEKITPRKDRWPTDVPQAIHDYVDAQFKIMFGWKPRSQGVFTTGSFMNAANFGIPMVFFPIGKYKYVWGAGIQDFIGALDGADIIEMLGGNWKIVPGLDPEEMEDRIEPILQKYVNNKLLGTAIKRKEEIIFLCKEYYLVDNSEALFLKRLEEEIWK